MDKDYSDNEEDYSEEEEDDDDCLFINDAAGGAEDSFSFDAINQSYLNEITDLLGRHKQVSCDNALQLNKQMQYRLLEVRQRLQTLLQTVKARYVANEERLKESLRKKDRGIGMRGAYLKGGTFYFKGNMFFKDANCRNCPNNADYEQRKSEGEMFPMDFELCGRHVWSMMDKIGLVQAIKEQTIDYLADHKRKPLSSSSKTARLSKEISVHSESLVNLLAQVDENFHIDWEQISAHNLRYRHSPASCQTMWKVYLHPTLRRKPWTAEERQRLLEAAQLHNYQNWELIAAAVGKRSDYQCFIEYQTSVCYMEPHRWCKWNKSDDQYLLQVIEKHTINGVINWNIVASHFPYKSKSALHQRYQYSVNPKISHAPFTAEEDLILLAAVEEYGEKFSCFPRTLFPNRSITQLRSRYKNTLRMRHTIAPWSVEDDKKLMEFVSTHGTSAWLQCSVRLGNHNRISCRTRFLTIQKFFEKNPNAVLEDLPRKKECKVKNSIITTKNWVEKLAELRENPDVDLKPPPAKRSRNKNEAKTEQTSNQKPVKEKTQKLRQERNVKQPKPTKILKKKIKTEADALLQQQRRQGVVKLTQPAPKPERKPHKNAYVNRLRAIEKNMYHYFKYSYNFKLGVDPCTQPAGGTLHIMSDALGLRLLQHKNYVHDYTVPRPVRQRVRAYLQRHIPDKNMLGYQLPPSWSTAMGFRALCILAAQNESKLTAPCNQQTDLEKHDAVELFRKRLRALFYKTTLLSRLHPAQFVHLLCPSVAPAKNQKQIAETEVFKESEDDCESKESMEENDSSKQLKIVDEIVVGDFTIATVFKQEPAHAIKESCQEAVEESIKVEKCDVDNVVRAQLAEIDSMTRRKRKAPTEKTKAKHARVNCGEAAAQCLDNTQQPTLQDIKTEIEM